MLSREENELLTRTERGTPCGELMRRYWQPAALSEELPAGGPPVTARLLGEDLVLFRDEQGRPGLLGLHCSHRGADLSYGRLEDGGLRCIYHGWLYDIHGRCLEQLGEPSNTSNSWTYSGSRDSADSAGLEAQPAGLASQPWRRPQDGPAKWQRLPAAHERIRHPAYPCIERGGLIVAYLGPGEPPLLPEYEFLTAPPDHLFASKTYQECNYLQGNEGNIDPQHLSFLHRIFSGDSDNVYTARDPCPLLETEETEFGVRIYAVRKADAAHNYIRVTNFVLPNLSAVPGGRSSYNVNWHVPIDDTHHWRYDIRLSLSGPMDRDAMIRSRAEVGPGYQMVRSRANRFLQDREEMKTRTFSGMGTAFQAHDKCATEGAGPIQDRTQEHLGYTDKGIIAARHVLLRAVRGLQDGSEPPHVLRPPSDSGVPDLVVRAELIPDSIDFHRYWEREGTSTSGAPSVVSVGAF